LVESAGPLSLGFDVAVDEGNMLFTTRRAWVFGLPIPLGLAPNVRAAVKADELGWWLSVDVAVRGIGSLLGYEGHVTPE
ncbi:MAG: hypothetical protein QOD06_442, partial [Candidatus Binatota bacterium]|nr:hypothetical protein [Candidatus Binatota bacterium]